MDDTRTPKRTDRQLYLSDLEADIRELHEMTTKRLAALRGSAEWRALHEQEHRIIDRIRSTAEHRGDPADLDRPMPFDPNDFPRPRR